MSSYTEQLFHRASFRPLHRAAFTHRRLHTDALMGRRLYTQKLLHGEAFTQSSFYTPNAFTHTDATHKRNAQTSLPCSLCTQASLYRAHTHTEREKMRKAFKLRNLCMLQCFTQKFHKQRHRASQSNFLTQTPLHKAASFVEKLSRGAAFTYRRIQYTEASTQSSL